MSVFPQMRLRRLRQTESLRKMFDISMPGPEKFIWPVFVLEGTGRRDPIAAMPGQSRLSPDELVRDLEPVVAAGIGGILLFGIVNDDQKDQNGSAAWNEKGVVQQAVKAVRTAYPDLTAITDVCLCAYTSHGHCGVLDSGGAVLNDQTIALLAKIARSHADAGAHAVAPSAMMDGQVSAIRQTLDSAGLTDTLIMSYSTKFASAMYGPFREAEHSAPQKGDRKGYQASYANLHCALRESVLDEEEGADILMVKPGLLYLDILARLREQTDLPIAVYNVSGEYSMLIAAADRGWGDLRGMVRESIIALTRAGADCIISYWANQYSVISNR